MTPSRHPIAPPRDRAWVEVSAASLRRNLEVIGETAGRDTGLIPMVKADGYGLGMERVVRALAPAGVRGWGVATVEEGVALRGLGVDEPVMICAPVLTASLDRAASAGLVPAISDADGLAALEAVAERRGAGDASSAPDAAIPFQIEVDTGMGRSGFPLDPAAAAGRPPAWWPRVAAATRRGLRLHGVFTHLHSADAPDLESARRQIRRFEACVGAIRSAGPVPPDLLVHCAASAAALRLASPASNAARPGIFLYGASPEGPSASVLPRPVVAVRARVLLVRTVPRGTTLGYGATYRSRGTERWAAAGIGYGDGLPRVLANRASALARGRRAPIIGRISMDTTVLRVGADTAPGDVVTFVGSDGRADLPIEEVAEAAGTIPYEILTGLSQRLPRLWEQQPAAASPGAASRGRRDRPEKH